MRVKILHNNQPSKIDCCFQQSFNQTQKWSNPIILPIIWFGNNNHAVVIQFQIGACDYVVVCTTLLFDSLGDSNSINAHLYKRQLIGICSRFWLSNLHCYGNFSIQMYFLKYCWSYLWKIWCQLFYSGVWNVFRWAFWLTLKTSLESKCQIDSGLCFWPKYGRLY